MVWGKRRREGCWSQTDTGKERFRGVGKKTKERKMDKTHELKGMTENGNNDQNDEKISIV